MTLRLSLLFLVVGSFSQVPPALAPFKYIFSLCQILVLGIEHLSSNYSVGKEYIPIGPSLFVGSLPTEGKSQYFLVHAHVSKLSIEGEIVALKKL